MSRVLAPAGFLLLTLSGFALAQAPPPPPASQLTPQVLGEMLRTATTFHELVRSMNLNRSLGPDQDYVGPDGQLHHSVARTAATIGAGAGAGAAIGEMSHSPNGVLIGALVGSAGGLIVDQVLKHREEVRQRDFASAPPAPPDSRDGWHRLKERDHSAN
jgi:hypothetical protein